MRGPKVTGSSRYIAIQRLAFSDSADTWLPRRSRVCDALFLKCDRDDPMMEVIADKIVALAKAGEHDADRWPSLSSTTWLTMV
jgi:hypothetical protein